MSESKESDQAKELKNLLSDIEKPETSNYNEASYKTTETTDSTKKIDVLNLPPRKEIHSGKSNRIKLKITKPYIRLMVVVLMIVILFLGGFYIWGEELVKIIEHI